nr:hypothetical protein [Tanacetum cinerariifolium]
MADQRTMVELLCAPTEGYAEAIVVPPILAEYFELKHSLINMMTLDQFFGLEKDNPHDHILGESSPNPISSNLKRRNRRRLKQPFILEESPVDTMADQLTMAELLRTPTEGYAEAIVVPPILAEHFELKHSLINMMNSDQFFGLEKENPHDHIRASRRWLEKEPSRSILTWEDLVSKFINEFFPPSRTTNLRNEISNFQQRFDESFHEAWDRYKDLLRACPHHAKLTHAVNQQTNAVTTAMTDILKQFQATPPPASVKTIEEICVTCGGAHPYYKCLAADGNTFSEFRDNIQGYVSAAAVNYNQEKIKKMNEINIKAMQTQINNVKNDLRNEMKTSIQALMSNQTNELKNMMSSFFQMNTASISGSGPLPSNTIANPKGELKAITTRSGIVLDGPSQDKDEIQMHKFWKMFKQLHINITLADALILIPNYHKMLKALLSNKEKLLELANTPLNENCSVVILKKLPEKLGDPELISTRMTLELANQAICTPAGIARDVFVPVEKPFLRTAHALIDIPGEEMILRDGDERLTLNMRHDTSSYSNQPQKESTNMINIFNDSYDIFDPKGDIVLIVKFLNLDSTKDLPLSYNMNPLSGSTTSSSPNHLLKEFVDEFALITFPPRNDDLPFDIESDLREIEYLLNHDPTKEMDSILEDSVDKDNLADPNDNLFDTILEMFTDEHTIDYSSPPLYDEYDDDLVELESSDFLPSPMYDSFLFEDFSEVDALPSTNNDDKVFNLGILIHWNPSEVTVQVTPDKNVKKIFISYASLILEDFDPPLYELPFYKEVTWSETLLLFSFENEEKIFKPGILTCKGVHTFILSKLSHRGPKAFKVIKILESSMKIFPCSYR